VGDIKFIDLPDLYHRYLIGEWFVIDMEDRRIERQEMRRIGN